MKRLACDWDGTLMGPDGQWLDGAVEGLRALNRRYDVFVHTARANYPLGLALVRERLDARGFRHLKVEPKPLADMYLDDRALRFPGDWNGMVRQVRETLA